MNVADWAGALSDLEQALDGIDLADPDELGSAALALDTTARPPTTEPIPAALVEQARRLEQRVAGLIADLELHQAAVGSEIAAIAATAAAGDRPIPRFFDTLA